MKFQRYFNTAVILLLGVLISLSIWQHRQLQALTAALTAEDGSKVGNVEKLHREVARLRTEQQAALERLQPSSAEVQELARQVASLKAEAAILTSGTSKARPNETALGESKIASGEAEGVGLPMADSRSFIDTEDVAGKGPRWSHAQVIGPPDTEGGGDMVTAWAPRSIHMGEQWLQVGYEKPVEVGTINIHETYNPGAITKVAAIMADGKEQEIWSGTAPGGEPPVETSIPVPRGITSDKIKIYVDTDRVRSWPEIDAVEVVGTDGSKQWANSSIASSYYGDGQGTPMSNHYQLLDFRGNSL